MTASDHDGLERGKLRYVGAMGAGISHEIRNALATINEKTGLMSDLLIASQRGRPLDVARLQKLTDDVSRLVKTIDGTCGRLSRLSHSPDHDVKEIGLGEALELVVALMKRRAAGNRVELVVEPGDDASIESDPVLLQLALSRLIGWLIDRAPGASVGFRAVDAAGQVGVAVTGAPVDELVTAPPEEIVQVLAALDGTLSAGASDGSPLLLLPKRTRPR